MNLLQSIQLTEFEQETIMKRIISSLLMALTAMPCIVNAAEWESILGIPAPTFGVTVDLPTLPVDWLSDVPDIYYVCRECAGSSNVTYGNPVLPRSSMPSNISDGSIVVVAGSMGQLNVNFSCSEAAPCFLIGDPLNPPTFSGENSIGGDYYVIDNVHFQIANGIAGMSLRMGGSYGAILSSKITGNLNYGGAYTTGDHLLIMDSEIMDNGDVNASNDQDRHGIKVSGEYIWIIGNEFARNSGDGVQVGDIGTGNQVQHIYIGKNVSHDNKQTGFWVKESQDVIISENVAYGHRRSGSSDGEGMGGQYDSHYVWFLFNEIYDNIGGIGIKSSNNGGGSDFYAVGNYIHDNINPGYSSSNSWTQSAIASWNSADFTIVNNTLTGNSGGINLNGSTGSVYMYNNAILNMQNSSAKEILAEDQRDVQYSDSNAFDGDELIDAGMAPLAEKDPYTIFMSRYGQNITRDIEGNNRPIRQWDIGAFESIEEAGARPKPPVLQTND